MKKIFIFFCVFCSSCVTTESYYRLPQSYSEQQEAYDNPQNDGYVLRRREVLDVDSILGTLYVAATVVDLLDHIHNRRCRH